MNSREIAKQYGFERYSLEFYIKNQTSFNVGSSGAEIPDHQVAAVAAAYQEFLFEKKKQIEEENRFAEEARLAAELANQKKQKAIAEMLITSGFNFDGFRIVKYSGYISGDDAVEIPRSGWLFTTNNSQNLTDALAKIRIRALRELKEAAYDLGCNAVIGVDFDYITLEPETVSFNGGTKYEPYIICVTANGNAVVIEKE